MIYEIFSGSTVDNRLTAGNITSSPDTNRRKQVTQETIETSLTKFYRVN